MELAPFYVGQKVVSLITHRSNAGKLILKKGQIYTVKEIAKICKCNEWHIRLDTLRETILDCVSCHQTVNEKYWWAHCNVFAPIQENLQAISYSKVMEKESELICVN